MTLERGRGKHKETIVWKLRKGESKEGENRHMQIRGKVTVRTDYSLCYKKYVCPVDVQAKMQEHDEP